jgi:ribonuclease HII
MAKIIGLERPSFDYEEIYWNQGLQKVAGIDEAGRGPLAGPVVAAAVILDPLDFPNLIDDSKKLSEASREELYEQIKEKSSVSIALVEPAQIDEMNILQATFLAMKQAALTLMPEADAFLIDGNVVPPGLRKVSKAIVGGDRLSLSIAAASIVAKVTRDRLMKEVALRYPEYGFDVHMGYPTKAHTAAIKKYGPSPIHRMTFGSLKAFKAI